MTKVFISYSRNDLDFVKEIVSDLNDTEINAWYDLSRLEGGDEWDEKIQAAIDSCDHFILVVSPNSLNSKWVKKEILYAINDNKNIIPLLYQTCKLPLILQDINFIDIRGKKYSQNLYRILRSLDVAPEVARKVVDDKVAKEKSAREKAEKEAAERLILLNDKFNKVMQLERSGYLEEALNICYEIWSVDSQYPNVEKKIKEIEKGIGLRNIQEKEAAEKARLKAEERERQRIAKEKADREAAEKAAREKAEKEAAERSLLLNEKFNKALQLERSGYWKEALSIYYEITSIDSQYPNVEKKIQNLEKAISDVQKRDEEQQITKLHGKFNEAIQLERSGYLERALQIYNEIKSVNSRYPNLESRIQIVEKAILKAKEEEQQRIAREIANEKAERERAEKARLIENLLYEKTNKAVNLENAGLLEAALKIYYEIKSIDPKYPFLKKRIQDIENTIMLREKAKKETVAKNKENSVFTSTSILATRLWFRVALLIVFILIISIFGFPSVMNQLEPDIKATSIRDTITPTVAFLTETLKPATSTNSVPTSTKTPVNTLTPTPLPTSSPTKVNTIATPTLDAGTTTISDKDGMVMVYVPEGTFTMGNNSGYSYERPEHDVFLDAYWIDQTEVTFEQYSKCVEQGCPNPRPELKSGEVKIYIAMENYKDFPIIQISWDAANSYCEWAGRRLPTEAEWEKAARGTDARNYPWGKGSLECYLANVPGCGRTNTEEILNFRPVGSYPLGASPFGALDMIGNASEWVADWYDDSYYAYSPSENPKGPSSGEYRLIRGGSVRQSAKTTTRTWLRPYQSFYIDQLGVQNFPSFRCASDVNP